MTTGKDGLVEVLKKGCVVKCYNGVAVLGNTARPSCGEEEGLVCNPNKLINNVLVGNVRVINGTVQTSVEIRTHIEET